MNLELYIGSMMRVYISTLLKIERNSVIMQWMSISWLMDMNA